MGQSFLLDISIFFGRSLVHGKELDLFQSLLHSQMPSWSSGLKVWRSYGMNTPINVSMSGTLAQAVRAPAVDDANSLRHSWKSINDPHRHLLPGRVHCSEELRGANSSLIINIDIDDFRLKPVGEIWGWGNAISVQVCRARIEGKPSVKWSYNFFKLTCELLSPVHAFANMIDEFHSKNIFQLDGSVQAIGVDRSASLSGLYWLNYLGRPYCELIGRDRLMTAPASKVQEIGAGVMISLDADPRSWNTPEYQMREQQVIDHIGRQFVFDRYDPTKRTVAPDFGLPTLVPPWGARYLKAVQNDEGWSWQATNASE
ncbi:MAG: hypothetical protein IT193_14660 [Propionibacteriaceae bacterium]|nr:hypothetical protein [Propionibacteriaceae bacterium]